MPNYSYNNQEFTEQEILDTAVQHGLGIEEYVNAVAGLEKIDDEEDFSLGSLWKTGAEYIDAISTGWQTGLTNEENLEVFKGSTSLDDIEAMIKAGDKLNGLPQSDRMKRFQKKVEDNGGGFFSTLWALVGEDPVLASQIALQSMSMMAGAVVDSGGDVLQGKTGDALGYMGAGSLVGAGTFGVAGSIVPGLGNLVGAGTGAIAGGIGGLSTAMEHGLTFAEMLKEEMTKDGEKWEKESIKKWLETGDNYQNIKNRALRRGLTIGAIDMLSGGLAGAATVKTVGVLAKSALRAPVRKGIAVGAGIGVEGGAGGVGEFLGQKAGGQEYDAAEIIMEAFAQTPGAVLTSLPKVLTKTNYKINGQTLDESSFKKEIESMDDITIAMSDIEVKGDDAYASDIYDRQNKAIIDSQIDEKVTDQSDREKLIDLEIQRNKANSDLKKEGGKKVPKAKETLEGIEAQIDAIVNKYEGAKSTELLLGDETSVAARVNLAVGKKRIKGTIKFAKKAAGALGMEYVEAGETAKSFLQKYKEVFNTLNASQEDKLSDELVMKADGLIVKGKDGKNVVLINKEVAAKQRSVSVGSHEILHAVLNKHLKSLVEVDADGNVVDNSKLRSLIKDFRNTLKNNLDSKAYKAIEDRMNFYKKEYKKAGLDFDIDTTDEWFTAFSDSIVKGDIKFNEGFFQKIADFITPMLRAMGFKEIKFDDGKAAFDFVKEYSRNARKGNLVAGAKGFAGTIDMKGTALSIAEQDKVFTPQTKEEMAAEVNEIYNADTSESKDTAGFEVAMKYEGQANVIFQRYIDTADLTQDQIDVLEENKDDIIAMLLYDKIPKQKEKSKHRTVLGLVKDFKKEKHKHKNLAAYINKFFKERAKEVFGYFLPDAFVKSITDETISKKVSKITAEETAEMTVKAKERKPIPKVERQRVLQDLENVKLDSKDEIIKDIQNDIQQLIDLDSVNLNDLVEQLIDKHFTKIIMDKMGKISKVTGVSEQYKSWHDLEFTNIVKALPLSEIKKRYNKLFKIEDTGRREATAQGNHIFKIKPIPKAEFGKYFTLGSLGTLIERKRSLAQVIAKSYSKTATNNIIIENSNNPNAVFKATLDNLLNTLDKQKNELAKQDDVSLSISVEKNINIISELAITANEQGQESSAYIKLKAKYHKYPTAIKVAEDLINLNPDLMDGPKGFIPSMKNYAGEKLLKLIEEKQLQWTSSEGPNIDLQKNYTSTIDKIQKFIPSIIFEIAGFDWLGYKDQGRGVNTLNDKAKKKRIAKNNYVETGKKKDNSSIEVKKAFDNLRQKLKHLKKQDKTETWFKNMVWKGLLQPNISLSERLTKLKEIYNELKLSADAAKALLTYLTLKINVLHKNGVISEGHLYVMGQLQTNIVKGFRAFSAIKSLYLTKGKMVGMFAPRSYLRKNDIAYYTDQGLTIEAAEELVKIDYQKEHRDSWKDVNEYNERYNENKKDPDFKLSEFDSKEEQQIALELKTIQDLHYKNEHMGANAISMSDMVGEIITGDVNTIAKAEKIWSDHQTFWAPLYITKAMDKIGGKVTKESLDRGKFLPKDKRKNSYEISGEMTIEQRAREKLSSLSLTQEDVNNHNLVTNLSINPDKPKGITVLDFDDTLATTKSSVRYRLPNPTHYPGSTFVSEENARLKVVFMAGPPGSGKSNVIKQLGLGNRFKIVDSDAVLQRLIKKAGIPANMKNLTPKQTKKLQELMGEANVITGEQERAYQRKGVGVVVDGTGATKKGLEWQVKNYQRMGYDVGMIFVEASTDVAIARNKARKERSLPKSTIKNTRKRVMENKEAYRKLFGKNFTEVNTNNLKQGDPMPKTLTDPLFKYLAGYYKGKLNASEYAAQYQDLSAQGAKFDFAEFDKVVNPTLAPLFNKALKLQEKFGPENMFILTARPKAAQQAIYDFLEASGLNIPLKNISALGNSTAEAKALWVAEKVGEGYNDFYFADDALQNVQAVKNMLSQFDVKSKVQQAKLNVQLSLSEDLNNILEENEGIDANKTYSGAKARLIGSRRPRSLGDLFFNTAGSNDFMGLMYVIANAKGKLGEKQIAFFEDNLYKPYRKGVQRINTIKQKLSDNYRNLRNSTSGIKTLLASEVPGTVFSHDTAVRVYLWDKNGIDIPNISETDRQKLIKTVLDNPQLMEFADQLGVLSLQPEGYVKPGENWMAETILSDLDNISNKVGRQKFLKEFLENKDLIFSEKNLNKLEALYGPEFVESLKDMLYRMETGNNRPVGQNAQVNSWLNWVSNSVGAIMFFNMRSALLQTLSTVNFVNWGDNNPIKAAAALANFPQFLKDFTTIFNSDFLRQRRGGLKLDVNEARLAEYTRRHKNKPKAILAYLLKIGFLPTQMADSFAIAAGGATFLRNRINTYLKQGLSKQEAKTKAWQDMIDASEPVQQSSDPSLISKEQSSVIGPIILAFQNVTMQYSRRMKKAIIDVAKGRGDFKTNISRIVYYGVVQNLVFNALQAALFALAFDDEDKDDKKRNQKTVRVANGMVDSVLRGLGIPGAVVATAKNAVMEYNKQKNKGYNEDQTYTLLQLLNISPPIGSKARKIYGSTQTEKFNREIIPEMSMWDISNPRWQSIGSVTEGITNIPMNRAIQKANNVKQAMDEDNAAWQRIAMILGWNTWDVGVRDKEILRIKEEVKSNQKSNKKKSNYKSSKPQFSKPAF